MVYIHTSTFIRIQQQEWQCDVPTIQSALQPTSLPGILAYIASNVCDNEILKCSSRAETDKSIFKKELPVEISVIDRNYYIVAINYERNIINIFQLKKFS